MSPRSDSDTVSRQRIEELARQFRKLFVSHDFYHCGGSFAGDAISMMFDPTRALGRKKNSLEISDSKVVHFASQLRIQRPVKSRGYLIFNEVGSGNISERQGGQRVASLLAYVVIACAADVQITLFELVGEHEYLAKLVASHGEEHSRPEENPGELPVYSCHNHAALIDLNCIRRWAYKGTQYYNQL